MFHSIKINKGSFCLLIYSRFNDIEKVKLKKEYKTIDELIIDYNKFYGHIKLDDNIEPQGFVIIQTTNKLLIPIITKAIYKTLKEFEDDK
jgi:hypothetical protein